MSRTLQFVAPLSVALMIVGLIIGFTYPGRLTGALLPIGLTLWFIIGALGRRYDSP